MPVLRLRTKRRKSRLKRRADNALRKTRRRRYSDIKPRRTRRILGGAEQNQGLNSNGVTYTIDKDDSGNPKQMTIKHGNNTIVLAAGCLNFNALKNTHKGLEFILISPNMIKSDENKDIDENIETYSNDYVIGETEKPNKKKIKT